MEFSEKEKRQIEEIKSTMNCPFDFKCQKESFTGYPKVQPVATLLSCLQEEAGYCGHSLPFGNGFFCKCPLNKFVHRFGSVSVKNTDTMKA